MISAWDIMKPEFSPQENWGNHETIDRNLLMMLYCIRCDLKMPMIIHCGHEARGAGYHPQGCAVDFHFKTDLELLDQYTLFDGYLETKGWDELVGLGVYPDWDEKGFHLDTRGEKARWGRVNKKDYVPINTAFNWELCEDFS